MYQANSSPEQGFLEPTSTVYRQRPQGQPAAGQHKVTSTEEMHPASSSQKQGFPKSPPVTYRPRSQGQAATGQGHRKEVYQTYEAESPVHERNQSRGQGQHGGLLLRSPSQETESTSKPRTRTRPPTHRQHGRHNTESAEILRLPGTTRGATTTSPRPAFAEHTRRLLMAATGVQTPQQRDQRGSPNP